MTVHIGGLPAAPGPGSTFTVPGGPTEQQATQAAVDYGWLIAIIIVGALILAAVGYVAKQINFKLLGGLIVVGYIAYLVGKSN